MQAATLETGTREAQPRPASFSVLPRGQEFPPAPPLRQLPRLGKIWREYTSPGVSEVVQAITSDGEWLFELDGKTWSAGHYPTRTVVKTEIRSLNACRVYVGSGEARADLERASQTGATGAEA